MYASARHIVAEGRGYRDNLIGKGVLREKGSVVYNGVDLGKFRPAPKDRDFLRRHGLEGSKACGSIGTVGMAHGLEVMLKAAGKAKNLPWKFLIVGDGARCDELKAEAKRLGLSNVVFTGRLPKEDMPMAWASLDVCLIHLRKSELFQTVIPSKMFEAMGMEVPILMGVQGEALDIVLEAGAGIAVEPDDPDSLIEGCRRMFAADGGAYGRAGRRFVVERFNRDVLAEEYLEVLQGRVSKEIDAPDTLPVTAEATGSGR